MDSIVVAFEGLFDYACIEASVISLTLYRPKFGQIYIASNVHAV